MISRFELFQAARRHIHQMDDMDDLAKALDIDRPELNDMLMSIVELRNPGENAVSKSGAYFAGLNDGFMLGVKAQLAEMFVTCEKCGTAMSRRPDDPVPDDYDPLEHHMICAICIASANAHLN